MSMARTMAAGVAAFLLVGVGVSINASAEPPAARPTVDAKETGNGNANGNANGSAPASALATAARLDEQARRAESAARDGRTRASALVAVARLARAKADTLNATDRLEAEEGLAYLNAHIQSVESMSRGEDRSAAEFRISADRLRGRPVKTEVAGSTPAGAPGAAAAAGGCDPPFSFDSAGHKRWRAECF